GQDGRRGMPVVGSRDNYGIDLALVEQLAQIREGSRGIDPERLRGRLAALLIDIAEVGQFDLRRPLEQPGHMETPAATPDQSHHKLSVRSGCILSRGILDGGLM